GPKGSIERVAILGPTRSNSQVEISTSDARILGSSPVVRNSGDISNTPGITLCNGDKEIEIEEGLIVAARHIHMDKKDAQRFNVVDNEVVDVQLEGERGLVFNNVLVRVSDDFATRMHIDFDEANACGFKAKSTFAKILK
ncbi:MAG: PduL/EutD family phosphate acyltransferase, partial [Erysipelotrichales bacterium]